MKTCTKYFLFLMLSGFSAVTLASSIQSKDLDSSATSLPQNPSGLKNPGSLSKPPATTDIRKPSNRGLKNPANQETVHTKPCDPLSSSCPKDKTLPTPSDKSFGKPSGDNVRNPKQ